MKFLRFIFVWTVIIIVLVFSWSIFFAKPTIISPIPSEPQPSTLMRFFQHKKDPSELKSKIKSAAGDSWKNYSVFVSDFTSDFSMGINETEIFTAASVIKLPILASVYYMAQMGNVDLDRIVTLQAEDIQDFGTGSIRYDPPGTTYSVKTLAKLMTQQSDNTAAYILGNQIIGFDEIQDLVNKWGLTQTNMMNDKTSNADMEKLLRKMYTGGIANRAYTQEMLAFMKDTDIEDRIPAGVPKGATVYHKIGNEVGFVHDVGIVTNGKTTYYIGMLTSDIVDEEGAVKLEAKISKIVYDYMK